MQKERGRGRKRHTVQTKGMFFQLKMANISIKMREMRPGPVKKLLARRGQLTRVAAYPKDPTAMGDKVMPSARPPILPMMEGVFIFESLPIG